MRSEAVKCLRGLIGALVLSVTSVAVANPHHSKPIVRADCKVVDVRLTPTADGEGSALQLRTTDSKDVKLQLEIPDGRGGGTARATSNATLVAGAGWQTHRTFATLAWGGEATFGVRVFGASCENDTGSCQSSVQVAAVAIAPIGQAWAL